MPDLESKLRPVTEGLVEPGEELRGVCVAAQAGLSKGRTTDGEKLKLHMMRGTGPLGGLGGGEVQRRGVEAAANWFAARGDSGD